MAEKRRSSRRRRYSPRRRASGFRSGFISSTLLASAGGVAGGLIVPEMLIGKLGLTGLQSGWGKIVAKAGLGLLGGYFLRRFSGPLAASFAAGAVASAGLDLMAQSGNRLATVAVPMTAGAGVSGFIDDDDDTVSGFIEDDGSGIEGLGEVEEVIDYVDA